MSFNLKVISKSEGFDWTEFATGLVRIGEIDATSVQDMVTKVCNKASEKSATIDRLDIFAHGSNTYFEIGKDTIHSYTPNTHAGTLGKLKRFFPKDGIVVLNVCDIGQCEALIVTIARAVGVNVYACAGGVSPNLNIMWGVIVVGRPDGTFQRGVKIPVDPWDGVQS